MWARLQDRYLMPDTPDAPASGGSGAGAAGGARPPPAGGVGNTGGASSLSVPQPAAPARGTGSEAAPQRMGLLSRLLRSMNNAKERRRQLDRGDIP